MKILASTLILAISATSAMAYGSFSTSMTPTLTFPKDVSTTKAVTKEKASVKK